MYNMPARFLELEFMLKALPENYLNYIIRTLGLLMALSFLMLSGCTTSPTTVSKPSESANQLLLSQAQQAINNGEFDHAELALQQLEQRQLNKHEEIDFALISAELYLLLQEPVFTELFLADLADDISQATNDQEIRYGQLKARWHEANGQYLAAARTRDFQSSALSGEIAELNHEMIWRDLLLLNEEELRNWSSQQVNTQFGQWIELALISRNSRLTLDEQMHAVEQWQSTYPKHPASINLPGRLGQLQEISENRPDQIALLLPLSGPLEKTGNAIRDGFMAAYYESLNKGYKVPAIQVYDSLKTEDINSAYAQAQFDGAQWLVGPVEKPLVQDLSERENLPLPTLALNYSDRNDSSESPLNLFQFGLAAEDEAKQIADKAWQDGKRNALALVPNGNWGERVYQAFEQRWLELGGTINEHRFYPNRQDFNPDVRALLNVTDSQKRYQEMRRLLRQSTEFEPRRRQDADWLFLVALPQQARQIKPTLAFNFASDLPVYSTSHVYSGEPNPSKDRDLNGIIFCDTPWLLQHSELYQQVETSVNGQGKYARLYAMGVDAFRLLPYLHQLEASQNSQVFGSTGALQVDHDRRVVRRTECTVFRGGQPQRVSSQ